MVTNKRIKTTESLQKRFFNGSKNLVIEIEKLMVHQSAAKKRIIFVDCRAFGQLPFLFIETGRFGLSSSFP